MQQEGNDQGSDSNSARESGRKAGQYAAAYSVPHREPALDSMEIGMAAGVLGALAADAWFVLSSLVMGAAGWAPFRYISTILLGPERMQRGAYIAAAVALGFVLHLVVMSLLGGVYGIVADGRRGPVAPVLGACYGLVVWVLVQYVVFPLTHPAVWVLINPFILAVSMLYYGLILGQTHALLAGLPSAGRRFA